MPLNTLYTHYKNNDYIYLDIVNPLNDVQIKEVNLKPYKEDEKILAEHDLSPVDLYTNENGELYYTGDFPVVLYRSVETEINWLREVSDFYATLETTLDLTKNRRFTLKNNQENEMVVMVENNHASFLDKIDFENFKTKEGKIITKNDLNTFDIFPKLISNTYILKDGLIYDINNNLLDIELNGLDLHLLEPYFKQDKGMKVFISEVIYTETLKTVYNLKFYFEGKYFNEKIN